MIVTLEALGVKGQIWSIKHSRHINALRTPTETRNPKSLAANETIASPVAVHKSPNIIPKLDSISRRWCRTARPTINFTKLPTGKCWIIGETVQIICTRTCRAGLSSSRSPAARDEQTAWFRAWRRTVFLLGRWMLIVFMLINFRVLG